jgi:hypothetical protein
MDAITVITLITSVLGIPASIYALVQIRRDRRKPVEDSGVAQQKYIDVLRRLSELPDRVLITFNKDNIEKEGTFEHLVFSFWNEFARYDRYDLSSTRVGDFIYNPIGILAATRLGLSYQKMRVIEIVTISLLVLALPLAGLANLIEWVFGGSKPPVWIVVPASIFGGAWLVFAIALCAIWLYRNSQKVKDAVSALNVAQKYVETLERLEISVREEFTQSRAKFQEYHGSFPRELPVTSVTKITRPPIGDAQADRGPGAAP